MKNGMFALNLTVSVLMFAAVFPFFFSKEDIKSLLTLSGGDRVHDQQIRKRLRRKEILRQKENFLIRIWSNIQTVINEFEYVSVLNYLVLTGIFCFTGFIIGQVWNNIAASVILAVTGAACPYFMLRCLLARRLREKDEKILVVMGDIQSELIQTMDFVKAIKNKLPEIKRTSEALYKHFKWYVDMIYRLTPDNNIPYMEELAEKIDNYFFSQYVKLAIGFEKGQRMLVFTMQSIPSEYSQYLSRMRKYSRIVKEYNKDFITKIILLPLVIGFLRIASKEFYDILTRNFLGQLTLVIVLASYITGAFLFTRYNKEIKLEE